LQVERGIDRLADLSESLELTNRFAELGGTGLNFFDRRAFSIAITAWSAKVPASSICFSVNGRTARRPSDMTPIGLPSRKSGTPRSVL